MNHVCQECGKDVLQIVCLIPGEGAMRQTRQEIVDPIPVQGYGDIGEDYHAPINVYTPHRWTCLAGRIKASPASS